MEIKGEYQINADRETVWRALNDPEMLQKCIPGCESLEKTGENRFAAKVKAAIGPVRANFNTTLSLEDLNPPESYRLVGESKAAAGFGSGGATVTLEANDDGTLLVYDADFKVGGKLAQVGSRLVLGATRHSSPRSCASSARRASTSPRVWEPKRSTTKAVPSRAVIARSGWPSTVGIPSPS